MVFRFFKGNQNFEVRRPRKVIWMAQVMAEREFIFEYMLMIHVKLSIFKGESKFRGTN